MRSTVLRLGPSLLLAALIFWLPTSPARAEGIPEGLPHLGETAAKTTISLGAEQPTSSRDIYRALALQAGIKVIFDPRLRDANLTIDLEGLDLRAALDRTSQAAGHFWRATDAAGIVVADDTPQNRRTYELQVIRTFDLGHIQPAELMTVLRSVMSLKNVAITEGGKTLTMRDTAAKVAIASRIIERLDRPRPQIILDLVVMRVRRAAFADLRAQAGDAMLRLTGDQRRRLRASATVIAEPTLSIVGGDSASHKLAKRIKGENDEALFLELELAFEARLQETSATATLGVRTTAKLAGIKGPISSRTSSSTIAVNADDAVAFFDWLPLDDEDMSVLIIRPRLQAPMAGTRQASAGFVVGTESNLHRPAPQ